MIWLIHHGLPDPYSLPPIATELTLLSEIASFPSRNSNSSEKQAIFVDDTSISAISLPSTFRYNTTPHHKLFYCL